MNAVRTRLKISLAIMFVLLSAGTVTFIVAEGYGFFDSLYFSIVTMATVGYGDIYPHTVGGRFATLIIIVGGLSFVSYVAFKITGLFFEQTEDKETLMEKKLESMDIKIDRLQEEMNELKKILKETKK